MWSYMTLPTISTGCGMSTDHFSRAGVNGIGARLKCGMPASLATVDMATLDGTIDEPIITSALDSVTKRRALVVAAAGSPPSSSTISFSGTPPMSFGTNSSALRSGTPRAAAGPVLDRLRPMVISAVWACAGAAMASDAATAAARWNLVMWVGFQWIRSACGLGGHKRAAAKSRPSGEGRPFYCIRGRGQSEA